MTDFQAGDEIRRTDLDRGTEAYTQKLQTLRPNYQEVL